jgi:hypothetical protein
MGEDAAVVGGRQGQRTCRTALRGVDPEYAWYRDGTTTGSYASSHHRRSREVGGKVARSARMAA